MDRQTAGRTGNVSAQMSIATRPWGCSSLFVPRTLKISSSVSTTLQNNQSSSYTSMSLRIDLIEHIVDKVLRNPLGASLLPSNLWSLYSNPQIYLLLPHFLFSLLFCPDTQLCLFLLSFLSPSPPFSPFSPSTASSSLNSSSSFFPTVSNPVFQSELHALTNIHPFSSDVMDLWSQKANSGGQPIS